MNREVRSSFSGPKFNLRLWTAMILVVSLFSFATKAEEETLTDADLVEVRTRDEVYEPYTTRRTNHGWIFDAGIENYKPTSLLSSIDQATYEALFDTADLSFGYFETGYQYNMGFASVAFTGGFGMGSITDTRIGEERTLSIEKTTVKATLTLDGILSEPYFAPYFSVGMYRFGIDEEAPASDLNFSGQTQMGSVTTFGALIQLNWLEEDVAREGLLSAGLENTYLNVFMSQYGKTGSENDPDTSSGMNWGAGLRMEF